MALQFNPPDWAIQEYLNRKTPAQEATEGLQLGIKNYMEIDQAKRRNAIAAQEMAQRGQMIGMKQAEMGAEIGVQYDPNNPAPFFEAHKQKQSLANQLTQSQIEKNKADGAPTTYYDQSTGQPQVTLPPNGKFMPQPSYILAGTQNGQPVFANPKTMEMKAGKLPGQGPLLSTTQSEGQANAGLYASRMEEADKQLAQITSGTDLTSPGSALQRAGPNVLQSEAVQLSEQAKRNFLNAALRRESGAAIAPSERKDGDLQYFPVLGDTPATSQQKAQNRKTAIAGIRNASGMPQSSAPAGLPSDKKARLDELRRKKVEGTLR